MRSASLVQIYCSSKKLLLGGFAFSQDEDGALSQSELIRVDRSPPFEKQQPSVTGLETHVFGTSSDSTQSSSEKTTQQIV